MNAITEPPPLRAHFPLPKRGTPAGDKIAWWVAHEAAMLQLPRVLAGMGFTRHLGPLPRGGVAGFEPAYATGVTIGLGVCTREEAALRNRIAARRACRLMVREDAPKIACWVCQLTGEWRDARGGAFGEDLLTLGAYAWSISYGRAAHRIARLAGHGELPRVGDLAGR